MHLLLLRPVRLPLLPLDLGPARGVEVCLVARPVRASAPLSPQLLRELGRGRLLVRSGLPLPAPLPRLPLPAHHSTLCDVVSRGSLRRSAPVLDPPVFPDLWIEEQGGIVGSALGRPPLVMGPVVLALALLTACGQAVESVGGGPRLGRCPTASGHNVISHGLRTAADRVDSARDPLLVEEVVVTIRGHAIPLSTLVTARGHVCGLLLPLTARGERREDGEPDVSGRKVWRR